MPFHVRSPRASSAVHQAKPMLEDLERLVLRSGIPDDFDGDGKADYVVFDKTTATFDVTYASTGATQAVQIGDPSHDLVPVPGDYSGSGHFDFAIYDRTNATFYVKFASNPGVPGESCPIGNPAHAASIIPVPGDYNGDHRIDFAIYDQSVATYFVKDAANPGPLMVACPIGDPSHGSSNIPLPGIYQGSTEGDFAIYDKTVATFFVKYATNPSVLGASCSVGNLNHAASIIPVPADYDGDGRFDFGIFDRSVSSYFVKYATSPDMLGISSQIGDPSHANSIVVLPGDYDEDGKSDFGIYDKTVATFFVKTAKNPHAAVASSSQNGDPAHANSIEPIPNKYAGTSDLDFAIYDSAVASFFVKFSSNPNAGPALNIPGGNTSHIMTTIPSALT